MYMLIKQNVTIHMHGHVNVGLTFTHLEVTQHLWHHAWACECMFMVSN